MRYELSVIKKKIEYVCIVSKKSNPSGREPIFVPERFLVIQGEDLLHGKDFYKEIKITEEDYLDLKEKLAI
jgi:hypothetical protein